MLFQCCHGLSGQGFKIRWIFGIRDSFIKRLDGLVESCLSIGCSGYSLFGSVENVVSFRDGATDSFFLNSVAKYIAPVGSSVVFKRALMSSIEPGNPREEVTVTVASLAPCAA